MSRVMSLTEGKGVNHWLDTVGCASAEAGLKTLRHQGTMVRAPLALT